MKDSQSGHNNFHDLFEFARTHLETAFPNPGRQRCPTDAALRLQAVWPRAGDPNIVEHISHCSPCFTRYKEILAFRSLEVPSPRIRIMHAVLCAIAILSLGLVLYIAVHRAHQNATEPAATYVRVSINLEDFAGLRGPEQQKAAALTLSRKATELHLELPMGSEGGTYNLSLQREGKLVWNSKADAKAAAHRLTLDVRADFSQLPAGRYTLEVEAETGATITAPIIFET